MLTLCILQKARETNHVSCPKEAQLEGRETSKQVITHRPAPLFTGLGLFVPPRTSAAALSPVPWT